MLLAQGVGARAGVAEGPVVLSGEAIAAAHAAGTPGVYVGDDAAQIGGDVLRLAVAIVTPHGGLTSDSALMARHLGLPCVVAARGLRADTHVLVAGGKPVAAGARLRVDGQSGTVELL